MEIKNLFLKKSTADNMSLDRPVYDFITGLAFLTDNDFNN